MVEYKVADEIIDMTRCHAGFDFFNKHVEAFCDQTTGPPHALKILRFVDSDLPGSHRHHRFCFGGHGPAV
jgi:hypothetical protein